MEQENIKGIVTAILFLFPLVAGLLPLKIRKSHTSARQRFLSYCNCFAGGAFFATCLLDLLPMIREKYQQAFNLPGIHTVFPAAEFTTCMGFLMVLTVEQIVHTFHASPLLQDFHGSHSERQPLLHEVQPTVVQQPEEGSVFRQSSPNHSVNRGHPAQESSLRVYILILALSLHSVFEGVALGLITDVDRLAQIAVVIVIHRSIIAFSLGISQVLHEMPSKTIFKSAILFSIVAPIGVGIGMAVLSDSTQLSSGISSGLLQGIANGTFLFVTLFEIFQRELEAHGNRLLKVLFMIVGYSVVTVLLLF